MTKSELIELLADKQPHLQSRDVEYAVTTILDQMAETLATGERIEVRGFGAFSVHTRKAKTARNPKTGEPISVPEKHVPHFKPGKVLADKVNC